MTSLVPQLAANTSSTSSPPSFHREPKVSRGETCADASFFQGPYEVNVPPLIARKMVQDSNVGETGFFLEDRLVGDTDALYRFEGDDGLLAVARVTYNDSVLSGLSEVLFVGAGGFIGASLRYVMSGLVQRLDPMGTFPYGTMSVNVLGCLLIGILAGFSDAKNALGPNVRLFVILGILGGFTTFSTFAIESLALVRDGESLRAGANVLGSVAACLVSVWLGYALGNR